MSSDDTLPVLHKHTAWAPKRWEAVHEQMVAMSCRGLSNKAIAETLGYNELHVGRIINSPQGRELAAQYTAEVRKKLMDTADMGLEVAQMAAAENVKAILTNKELAARQPFHMVRASMDFLKGMGRLKDDTVVKQAQNNQFNFFANLDPALQKQLADGMAEAREVMKKDEIVVEEKAS
jgi:hypothetical protein